MPSDTERDRPNILMVSIDSLRADFCSYINDTAETTPNLDGLAAAGIGFHHAISPSTWTLPVHGSVFTGLYPKEHNVIERAKRLGDHPTLAETLSELGYKTKSFSRNTWLDRGDILRGFSHTHYNIDYRGVRWELAQVQSSENLREFGHSLYQLCWTFKEKLRRHLRGARSKDCVIIEDVIDQLQSETEPFCYFVHLNDAHNPYRASAEFNNRFGNHTKAERNYAYQRQSQFIDDRLEFYLGNVSPSNELIDAIHDLYRGCIKQVDWLLGRLLDALKRAGVYDNTVVVVFGDHGDHLGDDGHYGHHLSVDNAVIRVPLVIRIPSQDLDRDGKSLPVQLNDLYPTLLELTNAESPDTNSISIINGYRSTAFVHYIATQGFIKRIQDDGRSLIDRLRTEQYAAWRSPDNRLSWFPSSGGFETRNGEFVGPADDDPSLRDALFDHFDRLDPIQPHDADGLDDSARVQLEAMGYL